MRFEINTQDIIAKATLWLKDFEKRGMNNLEEVYTILYGASNTGGVKYDVIKRWFIECRIIDDKAVVEDFFDMSYERVCPNREDLTLTNFVILMGILARETRQDVRRFQEMFEAVKRDVLEEIQERIRNEQFPYTTHS